MVTNIQQALAVMSKIAPPGKQPDPEAERVLWLLEQAVQGHCSNEAAFRAFESLAGRRGYVGKARSGKAVVDFLRSLDNNKP